jgi:hypothetical protein
MPARPAICGAGKEASLGRATMVWADASRPVQSLLGGAELPPV